MAETYQQIGVDLIMYAEHTHTINGVIGRMHNRIASEKTGLFVSQKWSASRTFKEPGYKKGSRITVELRFDDECKNGHQTFAITAHVQEPREKDWAMCGCLYEEISKYFPELAHLIKWHLTSTTGPMHYLANTTYHASARDHNGLLKGEKRQIVNSRTKRPCWKLGYIDAEGNEVDKPRDYLDSETKPDCEVRLAYVPLWRVGEGKERDFKAARSCAVWADATDETLSLPKSELSALLLARLPQLIADFKADMLKIGFEWRETK
jgi:hypothetical protein